MNQQANDAITQALQDNWTPICHAILERFTTVSKADLDAALDADDLVSRVTSITKYDPAYIESEVAQLVGVGAPVLGQQQQQFGQQSQQGQQFAPQQQFQGQGQQGQGQRRQRSQRSGRQSQSQQWQPQQSQQSLGSYGS